MPLDSDWLPCCLTKPGAWHDEPWHDTVVAKVGPKIFAFLWSVDAPTTIGLKCGDRETADVTLERWPDAAAPMPYLARYGWNSFRLDGSLDDKDLADLVRSATRRERERSDRTDAVRTSPLCWDSVHTAAVSKITIS